MPSVFSSSARSVNFPEVGAVGTSAPTAPRTPRQGASRVGARGASPRGTTKAPGDASKGKASTVRRGTLFQRSEQEQRLLSDEVAEEAERAAERRGGGGSTAINVTVADAQGTHEEAVVLGRQHDFVVVKDAPASSKAAAVVTLRQRTEAHNMAVSMRKASVAFPGQLRPGAPPRKSLAQIDDDLAAELKRQHRRSTIANQRLRAEMDAKGPPAVMSNLPPAAMELLHRQMMEQQGAMAGHTSPTITSKKAADAFMDEQLQAMQREARTASRLVEQRLMASLHGGAGHGAASPAPTSPSGAVALGRPATVSPTAGRMQSPRAKNQQQPNVVAELFNATLSATRVEDATSAAHAAAASSSQVGAQSPTRAATSPGRAPPSRSQQFLPRIGGGGPSTARSRQPGGHSSTSAAPNSSRPSTQQQQYQYQQHTPRYDERVTLNSRNGRRVPASRVISVMDGAPVVATAATAAGPPATPAQEPTPRLVHDDAFDDHATTTPAAQTTAAAPSSTQPAAAGTGTGVRFRLSSARAKSPQHRPAVSMPYTPSTNLPPAPPSREAGLSRQSKRSGAASSQRSTTPATGGGALASQVASALRLRPRNFGEQSAAAQQLVADFERWAPSMLEQRDDFASLSRWAAFAMEQARQRVERVAAQEAAERGSIEPDISELVADQARNRADKLEATLQARERRRQAMITSGEMSADDAINFDDESDDEDFDEMPTEAARGAPNRYLLSVTLMIVDQAMLANPAARDMWPQLRDELFAALFVDHERTVTDVTPLTLEECLEQVEATGDPSSVPARYADPRGADAQAEAATAADRAGALAAQAPSPADVLAMVHSGQATFEEYRRLRLEHKRVTGIMASQARASDRLAMITQMAFNRNTRRAIIGAFTAWRSLTRRTKLHRLSVQKLTTHKRETFTVTECFREWRRVSLQAKLRTTERKLEDQRQRFLVAEKEHTETINEMNARYDADVKALEFELFQEAETRKNTLQVHQLEQEEWARELSGRETEVTELRRVVRQWQRAAQLSNPVDDPTPPPAFLIKDVLPLKALEDTLMSFYVHNATTSGSGLGTSGIATAGASGMMLSQPGSPALATGAGAGTGSAFRSAPPSFRGKAMAVGQSASPNGDVEVGGRIVEASLLEYIAGGWSDSIPAPPGALVRGNAKQGYTELVANGRRDLETFLCTWVNFEIRNVKLPQSVMSGGASTLQISNCTTDLRDGTVYLALCRALTPKEHQRKGDLDVFLTLTSLMALQTSHGLMPPLLLQCPFYKEFFSAEAFRPTGTSLHGPTVASQHPTAGLWILASLFVSKCLKTATSSKFAVHESLCPQVCFSPAIAGMPRPPASVLVCSGPDFGVMSMLPGHAAATAQAAALGATRGRPAAAAAGRSASPRRASSRASVSSAGSGGGGGRLALRSLGEGGFRSRRRPDSAASSRASTVSSLDSEYDEDDEWLAAEDDDNFRVAVPEGLRRLGPSELIAHWLKLREHGQRWNGLARVVTALVTRHRVLDVPMPAKGAAAAKSRRGR